MMDLYTSQMMATDSLCDDRSFLKDFLFPDLSIK
jgi:hypothetical protein